MRYIKNINRHPRRLPYRFNKPNKTQSVQPTVHKYTQKSILTQDTFSISQIKLLYNSFQYLCRMQQLPLLLLI